MSNPGAAQVVLEYVLTTALEDALSARQRKDDGMLTALYGVLSMGIAQAEALGVEFEDARLRDLKPDDLLK